MLKMQRAFLNLRAVFYAFFEFAPFITPVILVLAVYAWLRLPPEEYWFIPEWWVAIVFMLFEIQRDGMKTLKPKLKGMDGIALFNFLGSLLLVATIILVFVILHSKKPEQFGMPNWADSAQRAFLLISAGTFLFVKYLVKKNELLDIEENASDPFRGVLASAAAKAASVEVDRLIRDGDLKQLEETTEVFERLFGGGQ